MMGGYYDGGSWLWMMGVFILFWVGVAALVVWAIRAATRSGEARPGGDAAVDVLRRRLAAGEITLDEFERTRKVLRG